METEIVLEKSPGSPLKKYLSILVKLLLAGGILVYLILKGQLNPEKMLFFRNYPYLTAMMMSGFVFLSIPVIALRWWLLLCRCPTW